MKITRDMLRTDLPSVREDKSGGCNCVLAVWRRTIYDDSNTYIPRWTISNTEYYEVNADKFEGWIDLEDLVSSYMPDNVLEVENERALEDS